MSRPSFPRGLAAAIALVIGITTGCTGKYVRPTTQDKIEATAELIQRGSYLVNSVALCGTCHTPRVDGSWLGGERADAFLSGGMVDDQPDLGFKISVPNITGDRDTGIGAWSDDEVLRAIRDGVSRDGSLMMPPMPFGAYGAMSDDDARAIVAFLRTVPGVKNPPVRVREFPFAMRMAARFGALHHEPARAVKAPDRADAKAYGGYLARLGGCYDCHSLTSRGPSEKNLFGGSEVPFEDGGGGKVWSRNLTPDPDAGLGKYNAAQIKQALKTGKRLDGKMMASPMSLLIPHISTWNEEDLDALVVFLQALPPVRHLVAERQLSAAARKLAGE